MLAVAAVVLVAVDGLAQQRDLLAPLGGELADLRRDLLRMPALLRPADARHDAVGAELVAADHDPHERLERRGPHRRVARADRSFRSSARPRARDASLRSRLTCQSAGWPVALDLLDQLRQPGELAGAADDVDVRGAVEDQLLVFLRHAAQHADDRFRVSALVRTQAAQGAVDLVLGVLADAARVEEDRVGLARATCVTT